MKWLQSALTDHQGEFDAGRILVAVVILAMCGLQAWDTGVNKVAFNAMTFGTGVGAVLAGFAAYLYGDAKRPATTTVLESRSVTTRNES
jgi:hypothetical protein